MVRIIAWSDIIDSANSCGIKQYQPMGDSNFEFYQGRSRCRGGFDRFDVYNARHIRHEQLKNQKNLDLEIYFSRLIIFISHFYAS